MICGSGWIGYGLNVNVCVLQKGAPYSNCTLSEKGSEIAGN